MNSDVLLIANSSAAFLPPLTLAQMAALLAGVLLLALVLRWLLGPANSVSRRYGLWAVRGMILAAVGAILLNPVWIDELPGPMKRPEVFYLLDTSASMQMGNPRSRWDESLALIDAPSGWVRETAAMDSPPTREELIRAAYLRTVCRPPTPQETNESLAHIARAKDLRSGLADVLWALVNTKEFLLNH